MLPFLSCLSFHPENHDSDIFRTIHNSHFFIGYLGCQNLDLPDCMILRMFRCCRFYPVYPSILKIMIQTFPSTIAISSEVRPYNKYTI